MQNYKIFIAAACVLSSLLAVAACSDPAEQAPVDHADTGADADSGARIDVGPDRDTERDTARDVGDVVPSEATVTAGGAEVTIGFNPFRLEVRDAQGNLRTSTPPTGEPGFSGIDLAKAVSFNARRYYDPQLNVNQGLGSNLKWYRTGAVLGAETTNAGAVFTVATVDEDGEPGPAIMVEVAAAEHSVIMTVTLPDEEAFVHGSLSLVAEPGEGFYGLGEQFDRLDNRGLVREMQIQMQTSSESSTNEVHVPVPFYLSTNRYGLFVEDRHVGAFDLGHHREDVMRVVFNSASLRYHFFVDDDPMGLIETYTDITGKPAHVPFWALAPIWWRNSNESQAEVLEDAERGRELGLPSTVMWIDRPWQTYYQNWTFNPLQFPDPQAMMDRLHALGHRVLLHHSPQMNVPGSGHGIVGGEDASEGLFEMYRDNGWLVTNSSGAPLTLPWGGGEGAFIDYSHEEAVAHVQQTLRRVADLGIVGTKMDWDEYLQPNVGPWIIPMHFANGETNMTMKGWYSALYHKAIIEGFDAARGEPTFHLSRSGAPGDQVWNTCIWPGDLDNDFTEHTRGPSERQELWNVGGMPAAIVANQSLGMGGYPCFGSDIGGYRNGQPDQEVIERWLALGTFNAVMQLGGGGRTHMPWSADTPYDEQALNIARRYFRLRMDLFPYIFHHMLHAERTGRPLVRSLWLAYPDDPTARLHERDFLFGPDILVAPVFVPGAVNRDVYLPDGAWIDYWTNARVQGGAVITASAPIDTIPIYLREGALIPLADAGIDTLVDATVDGVTSYQDIAHTRFLIVPASTEASLSLFNGVEISAVREAATIVVELAQGEPHAGVDARVAFAPERYTLHIMLDGITDGETQTVRLSRDEDDVVLEQGEDCRPCWSYDRGKLDVRLDGPGRVVVEY